METKRKQTFTEKGTFFKGNLHSHTLHSDGKLTPKQLIRQYKAQGYQFVAITDHNVYGTYPDLQEVDMLVIPGFEGNVSLPKEDEREFHVVFLNESNTHWEQHKPVEVVNIRTLKEVNTYILDMKMQGFMAILAHPHWSLIEYDEILQLPSVDMVEIYNYGCAQLENMGDSYAMWQTLWRNGMQRWGVAVDDNHNERTLDYSDSFGGFIYVKAKDLSVKSILEAMKAGSFHASTGPLIESFYIEDDVVYVECSSATKIFINDHTRHSNCLIGENLTMAQFDISNWNAEYISLMVLNGDKKAYGNPIRL